MNIRSATFNDYLLLVILGACLGSAFMFMKIGVETIPPFTIVFVRLFIATIILALIAFFKSYPLPRERGLWKVFIFLGFSANLIPFSLITWSEIHITSGLASIYIATIPMVTILIAHFFTHDERLNGFKAMGVLFGFSGVVLLFYDGIASDLTQSIWAQIACFLSVIFYSISRVKSKALSHVSPVVTSLCVSISATVISFPFCIVIDQPWNLTPSYKSIASVVGLGILSTAFAFLILYYLISTVGAVFMTAVNFLMPIFGLLFGYVFLNETVHPIWFVSTLLIFVGLFFIGGKTAKQNMIRN